MRTFRNVGSLKKYIGQAEGSEEKDSNARFQAKRHYGVQLVRRLEEELLPSHRLRIMKRSSE